MKSILLLLIVGCTAILAQVDDFAVDGNELQNISVEDDFEGILANGNINEYDEQAISQAALSIISTGRPNCLNQSNWGRRFRHNWFITRFWQCNRWRTDLRACAIPRLYQPSLERCVWAWHWRWEPIQRDNQTSPPITTPTLPTTPSVPWTTTPTTMTTPWTTTPTTMTTPWTTTPTTMTTPWTTTPTTMTTPWTTTPTTMTTPWTTTPTTMTTPWTTTSTTMTTSWTTTPTTMTTPTNSIPELTNPLPTDTTIINNDLTAPPSNN